MEVIFDYRVPLLLFMGRTDVCVVVGVREQASEMEGYNDGIALFEQ